MEEIKIQGTKKDKEGHYQMETVHLYMCNIANCIKELVGNPVFHQHMQYAFQQVYLVDKNGVLHRGYSETWTGDWMCKVEVSAKVESWL
jgi:hypothetical protein